MTIKNLIVEIILIKVTSLWKHYKRTTVQLSCACRQQTAIISFPRNHQHFSFL